MPLRPDQPFPDSRAMPARRGFTLLEVMLAMAILVVLVSGLAGIASVSLKVGKEILDSQVEESIRDSFERLLRENMTEIPPDSSVTVEEGKVGGTQTVVLGHAAGLFPVSGLPLVTDSVALETRRGRAGDYALWLLYYAGDLGKARQDDAVDQDLLVQIPFRDGFELLEWKAYDPVADKWLTLWKESGRRPHFLELNYRFRGDRDNHRMVVWLPRLQSMAGGAGTGQTGGGTGTPSVVPSGPGGAGQNKPSGKGTVPGAGPIKAELR